ncbi:MAG TPA: outer membrane beta-barrel protein [Usitatibacter sp.]|nr:outer membrane beta-barrel protein [Usitatibacter sp.]
MKTKAAVLALTALSLPFAAAAGPWYAGISAGQSRTSSDLVTNRESTIVNATDIHSDFDRTDTAWKVFGGYRLHRNVAVELNYADLGETRLATSLLGGDPPLPATIAIDRKLDGYGADVLLIAPFEPQRLALFARAGAFRARLRETASLDGNIVFTNGDASDRSRSTTHNETVFHWGVGADWDFTPNVAFRLEWERYANVGKPFAIGGSGTTGEADTDAFSLGVIMRF